MMRMLARFAAYMFSIWFYVLDDVLLLVQLRLMKGKFMQTFKWAYARNIMCFCKNVMHLVCSILEVRYLMRNERKIEETFDKHSDVVLTRRYRESISSLGDPELAQKQVAVLNMFSTYMVLRKQRRFEYYNILQSIFRLLMLGNLLDLPMMGWMDEMLIVIFGIS